MNYQPPLQPNYPAPAAKKNTLAIVTLVTGLLGFCVLPVILGFISLGQIKKTGESGRGMAITGIVASIIWSAVAITVGVLSAAGSESAESLGVLTRTLTV
ncbi:DUF4190 domain-containing protein [Nocardia inohanensis]|uniref:DUF4190 domain-containing protein n=1 Tax=Nocardia inohanensis TaxID=209246 RepID=UPI000834BA11|nr:DUF4190 domain-containing protein [Nocardia inohanensis]